MRKRRAIWEPGTDSFISVSHVKKLYPSRGSWLLWCVSCGEITTGQMAFFTALAGLQPVLRAAVLHEVLPCLSVHQHDKEDRSLLVD